MSGATMTDTAPAAAAIAGGRLEWAIRETLLRYVLVVARGNCAVAGGVTMDAPAVFGFPLRDAVPDGDRWRLSFEGSVHLTAHHGFLDILIADPVVLLEPQGGVLLATTTAGATEQTPIARLAGSAPERVDGRMLWPAVVSELLGPAVPLFGNVYPSGTAMAPLAIRVPLSS
jgi:hypothetical protein